MRRLYCNKHFGDLFERLRVLSVGYVKQVEDEVLRQQIEQYNETVSRYQQYQQQHLHVQHYQHDQQQQQQQQHDELLDAQRRRQSAPTDVVQALLDISTLPSNTVHPPDTS